MTNKVTKELLKELPPRTREEIGYLLRQYPKLRLKRDSNGKIKVVGMTKAIPELQELLHKR